MHRSVDTLVRLHEKGKLVNADVEGTEYKYNEGNEGIMKKEKDRETP